MQEVHEIVLLNERNIVDLPISTPKRKFKCAKSWRDCSGGGGQGSRVGVTLFRLPFSREIIEIESLDSQAAILDECTKPIWPPVPVSARS